jgi:hypothetical protein
MCPLTFHIQPTFFASPHSLHLVHALYPLAFHIQPTFFASLYSLYLVHAMCPLALHISPHSLHMILVWDHYDCYLGSSHLQSPASEGGKETP